MKSLKNQTHEPKTEEIKKIQNNRIKPSKKTNIQQNFILLWMEIKLKAIYFSES